jgi:hypothetical protein
LAAIAAARSAAERRRQMPYEHPSLAQRLAHLWPPERPLNVALRDGSKITIGDLARRHWWREQGLRIKGGSPRTAPPPCPVSGEGVPST